MKTHLLAIGFVGVFCSAALSQSRAESDLYEKLLEDGPDSVNALEAVLKNPDEYSALILYTAAMVTFAEKRLEDSGFLYCAASFRADFDKECFPPKGTGGNSPFTALASLHVMLGMYIPSAVIGEPKAFEGSVARLKAWTPKASKDYNPGYEFTERRPEKEAHEAVKAAHTEFLDGMTDLVVLLNDTEYLAALRVVRAFNLGPRDKRPTQDAYERAMEMMRRIEDEKGFEGFADEPEDSQTVELVDAGEEKATVRCLGRMARKVRGRSGRHLQRTSGR